MTSLLISNSDGKVVLIRFISDILDRRHNLVKEVLLELLESSNLLVTAKKKNNTL